MLELTGDRNDPSNSSLASEDIWEGIGPLARQRTLGKMMFRARGDLAFILGAGEVGANHVFVHVFSGLHLKLAVLLPISDIGIGPIIGPSADNCIRHCHFVVTSERPS